MSWNAAFAHGGIRPAPRRKTADGIQWTFSWRRLSWGFFQKTGRGLTWKKLVFLPSKLWKVPRRCVNFCPKLYSGVAMVQKGTLERKLTASHCTNISTFVQQLYLSFLFLSKRNPNFYIVCSLSWYFLNWNTIQTMGRKLTKVHLKNVVTEIQSTHNCHKTSVIWLEKKGSLNESEIELFLHDTSVKLLCCLLANDFYFVISRKIEIKNKHQFIQQCFVWLFSFVWRAAFVFFSPKTFSILILSVSCAVFFPWNLQTRDCCSHRHPLCKGVAHQWGGGMSVGSGMSVGW